MGAMRPLQPPVVMITHGDNTDSITRLDHATDRQDKRRRHGGRRLHPPLSPFHLHHHHSRTGSPGPLLAILMLLLTSLHFTSSMQSSLSKESNLFSSSQVNKAEASSPELLSVIASNSSVSPNRTHHPHLHHHKHLHHNKHNSINAHHHNLTQSTNVTSSVDYSKIPDTLIGHHLDSHLHLLEPLNPNSARDSLLPFQHLPHPPPPPPRQESSSSSSSSSSDQQLLPTSMDGSSVDFNLMTAKGLKFEEEPSDSYIVRSKSAILRCKTLNALNAWFSCNSGDERKIQSNQKISNYVDPEKGIRMIEVDLEVTRSDVEEHTNSGYTNPFECWCTAYGGQHQIMSRKASVSFSLNGEWSNWGSWSPCHLPAGAKCGRGTQKRVRHCSNPGPVNNCPGDPVQVVDCNVQCSSNVDEYGWSAWSVWSPCAHDCTQVRRRVCNNPRLELDNGAVNGGVGATLNCLGHDYMVKNCTGGLCRKLFDPIVDPNRFPIGHEPIPIGPQPVPGPTTSLTATTTNEQIYFVIIFVLILIILLCILFIGFKFLNRRRHRGAKSGFHSGVQNGGVWSDMVQLERGQDEDAQAMLLMLQQQQNQLPGSNVQLQMSGLGSAQMARFQNGTGRHQIGGVRSLPFNGTTSSSSSGSSIGNGSTNQPEKYQLISRLKGNNIGNSNKPNLLLDHLLLRGTTADSHPPLPTIPSINSLNSYATNGSMNKYEEPIFPNGTVASMILRSPHPGAHYLHNSGKPPLPPVANQPTPSALSNTSGSNNTATISTNTTNTSESENNESEPDYAEPMINYAEGAGSGGAPRPPSVPPLSISCSTPLLPRSMASNALNNLTVSTGSSSTHSPHHPPLTFPTPSTSSQPPSSASPEIAFGKHEKFIKLTTDLLERGHYSMMPNLGVGIYLTPGFMIPDYRMANSQQSYYSTSDLYLRYGIDTAAKLPTSALLPNNNYCTLSSVVTVAFSKSPGTGAPPPGRASAELLARPFVLCFKHCIATRGNSVANLAKILSGKNLVVLWQDFDPKNSGSSIWTEIVCYGEENLNTACYLEFDANYVYLVSKFVGRYLLCIKSSDGALATRMQNADSMMLASPQLGPSSPLDFSKLVNFSLSIEQFSSTEHLVKVYCYDNLPSSTLNLRNELAPSSGASSCNSSSSIRLRLGKNANTCALRLCSRGGPICFELKPPDTARHRIKGMRRVEIPLAHLWYSMNSSGGHGHAAGPVHCSFVVMNNHTVIRECTRKQCSSGIYENEFVELDDEDEFESDSDDLVTEEEQESLAEESRPLRGNSRNSGGSSRLNTNTNHNQLDHYHESEHDLNYEVKVWQLTKPGNVPGGSSSTPISNVVLLNSSTTVRLCHPANTSPYYVERSLRHLFTETDLEIRDELIERLNMPRSDQLDWRTLASAAGFDHYLPYFASQPSPATSILELWEAKILNQLVQKRESSALKSQSSSNFSNANSSDLSEIKDIFYSKLVHLLQSIQRADLIEIILSNQC